MPFRFSIRWVLVFTTYAVIVFAGASSNSQFVAEIFAGSQVVAIIIAILYACFSKLHRMAALGFVMGAICVFRIFAFIRFGD